MVQKFWQYFLRNDKFLLARIFANHGFFYSLFLESREIFFLHVRIFLELREDVFWLAYIMNAPYRGKKNANFFIFPISNKRKSFLSKKNETTEINSEKETWKYIWLLPINDTCFWNNSLSAHDGLITGLWVRIPALITSWWCIGNTLSLFTWVSLIMKCKCENTDKITSLLVVLYKWLSDLYIMNDPNLTAE